MEQRHHAGQRQHQRHAGSDNGATLLGITPDGRFAVFESYSSNLSPVPATNDVNNLFVRDTVAGMTALVTVNPAGTQSASGYGTTPVITPDGKFVAFASVATNLTADVITGGNQNIFLRNLAGGSTVLVSVGTNGLGGHRRVRHADDQFKRPIRRVRQLRLQSFAAAYQFPEEQVFVRDVLNGTNRLVSIDFAGTNCANPVIRKIRK